MMNNPDRHTFTVDRLIAAIRTAHSSEHDQLFVLCDELDIIDIWHAAVEVDAD